MLSSFNADFSHLNLYLLKSLEDGEYLFSRDDKQLAFTLSNCCAIPIVQTARHKDIRIAEVRAFNIEIERDRRRICINCNSYIDVHLDSSLINEEYFFGVVSLRIKLVLWIDFHGLKQGKNSEEEGRVFVIKEFYSLDYLSISVAHNFNS